MVKRTDEPINGFRIKGVDGFSIFLQDEERDWFFLYTQGAPEWDEVPKDLKNTQGGSFLCAIKMLENNPKQARRMYDLDDIKSVIQQFGDS